MEHFLPYLETAAGILVPAVTYKLSQVRCVTCILCGFTSVRAACLHVLCDHMLSWWLEC